MDTNCHVHYPAYREAIAEYLTAMIEEGDPSVLAAALGEVARVKGMTEVARASGLTREALYKVLRQDAQPRFDTVIACASR